MKSVWIDEHLLLKIGNTDFHLPPFSPYDCGVAAVRDAQPRAADIKRD